MTAVLIPLFTLPVTSASYPVTLTARFQVKSKDSLPATAFKFSGMFISGSGILFSILFKNSTLDISTSVASFSNAAVTVIVTFLIATCLPKSMTMVLPAAESSAPLLGDALLNAARAFAPVCLTATPFSILKTTGSSSPSHSTVTKPSLIVLPEPMTGWIVKPAAVKPCSISALTSTGVSGVIAVSSAVSSFSASLLFPANTSLSVSTENTALLEDAVTAFGSTRAWLVTVAFVLLLFL